MNDLLVSEVVGIPLVFRKTVVGHSNRAQGLRHLRLVAVDTDVRNIADWYFEE